MVCGKTYLETFLIPHNIQQKLEEKYGTRYECLDPNFRMAVSDLWQILTEGPLEFDVAPLEKAFHEEDIAPDWYTRKDFAAWGARWQFDQLRPKMMAMEAEKNAWMATVKLERDQSIQQQTIKQLIEDQERMQTEIQRLRGTVRKVEPEPLTEEELKWIEEDERG